MLVLDIDAVEVQYFYSITCLTAPFLGVAIGGFSFHSMGGYNAPRSLLLLVVVAIICVGVAVPVPFLSEKWVIYGLLWALLFFGAFMLPTLTGMMLNSVTEDKRATANAIAVLCYNLTGYLPAPFLYGWISTLGIDCSQSDEVVNKQMKQASRRAIAVVMFWSLLSVGSYLVAAYYRLRE